MSCLLTRCHHWNAIFILHFKKKKSTPLNFLSVSMYFKMPFNMTSDTISPKDLEVIASLPLVHCIAPALVQNVYHGLSTAASTGANTSFQDEVKDNI